MITLRRLWLLAGFIGIEILLLLSFIFVPRFSYFANEDLLAHFMLYCLITLWFLLPYHNTNQQSVIILSFTSLAWLTELLQPLTPYHVYDWRDGIANTAGILTAAMLAKLPFFAHWSKRLATTKK